MVNDSVSDAINRIKQGYKMRGRMVGLVRSKFVLSILQVLVSEGYLNNVFTGYGFFGVDLRYSFGRPSIRWAWRISKPSRRVYLNAKGLKKLALQNVGVFFTSSVGVFSNYRLFVLPVKVGGEVLFGVR